MNRSVNRHWERACSYLAQGQVVEARAQLESLRVLAPDYTRTHLLAAQLAWYTGHAQDAATRALDAVQIVPDEPTLLCDAIDTLLRVGETAAAHVLVERRVWDRAPATDALLRYADFRQRFGEHTLALMALDQLIPRHPDNSAFHWYRGQQLEFLGWLDEAADAYETCLKLAPTFGHAAYQLVRLRRSTPSSQYLSMIQAGLQLTRHGSVEQADFEFASYHALEDLGKTDAAWNALERANSMSYARTMVTVASQQEGLRQLTEQMADHPVRVEGARFARPCPIFVIGMPRSGTTILERMLANHSCVVSAGELTDFGRQLMRAADTLSIYNEDFFVHLPTLDFADLGRRYLAQTAWRAGGKPYFIDKQPANWMVAGLVHAAIPAAKILHIVRDPMDICFSDWRARFAGSYAWSYDLTTLATRHRQYRRLMQYWHEMFPGVILDVEYAELVHHPAATLHKVFDFCGIAWEPGCEDLSHNATPVSTLSAPEVREPVHTRALGQWRRYATQLEPWRKRLLFTP